MTPSGLAARVRVVCVKLTTQRRVRCEKLHYAGAVLRHSRIVRTGGCHDESAL